MKRREQEEWSHGSVALDVHLGRRRRVRRTLHPGRSSGDRHSSGQRGRGPVHDLPGSGDGYGRRPVPGLDRCGARRPGRLRECRSNRRRLLQADSADLPFRLCELESHRNRELLWHAICWYLRWRLLRDRWPDHYFIGYRLQRPVLCARRRNHEERLDDERVSGHCSRANWWACRKCLRGNREERFDQWKRKWQFRSGPAQWSRH